MRDFVNPYKCLLRQWPLGDIVSALGQGRLAVEEWTSTRTRTERDCSLECASSAGAGSARLPTCRSSPSRSVSRQPGSDSEAPSDQVGAKVEVEMERDSIILDGMVFVGRHGVREDEQSLGQRFVVDVTMECDLRQAGATDDLANTVNYSDVHKQVRSIVTGPPVKLIETLAERIAGAILGEHPMVSAVRVRVSKPQVRLGETVLAGTAVEIRRSRDASGGRGQNAGPAAP